MSSDHSPDLCSMTPIWARHMLQSIALTLYMRTRLIGADKNLRRPAAQPGALPLRSHKTARADRNAVAGKHLWGRAARSHTAVTGVVVAVGKLGRCIVGFAPAAADPVQQALAAPVAPNHAVRAGLAVRSTVAGDVQWCCGAGWAVRSIDVARVGGHHCIRHPPGSAADLTKRADRLDSPSWAG